MSDNKQNEPVAWMRVLEDGYKCLASTPMPEWVPLYACTSFPIAEFSDAYQGAREDSAIWKKRALEAEELNRKFIADINGQTFMGEPAPIAESMVKPVTVQIPRPLYQQDAELDCMSVLQYTVDVLFDEILADQELERIGEWFNSRCKEKTKKGATA